MSTAGEGASPAPGSARIAVVLHEREMGGAAVSLLRVLPLLERRGWQFTFWVPGRGPAEQELRRLGHDVATAERLLRFSVGGLREAPGPARRLASAPAYLRRWRAWLRTQGAALVHANSILTLAEVASRPRGGPPLVLHTHEIPPPGAKGNAAALLARRADVVVSVSTAAAHAWRRRGLGSTVIYEAVPDPGPPPAPPDQNPLVVGTLATICRRKGSDLFLAAAQRIQAQRNGIEFRMVGDVVVGGERAWAQGIVDSAARSGIRRATGVDAFTELADWHVFVLPSRMDPCPLALLEAMAMGRAVVGTRVGGIPEQIGRDGGLLVGAEDVDGLVEAILRLAGSPELRASLGSAARRRMERLFNLERQADSLDRVYRGALDLSAAPARPG